MWGSSAPVIRMRAGVAGPPTLWRATGSLGLVQREKRKRLRRIARLPTAAGGKTFTSVRSIHRAWIVGVGGDSGDTIIFDTKTKEPWGTYAFDTNSFDPYEWHKVDDKRLPFIGRATPHGSLFLGLSEDNGPINAYRINVTTSEVVGPYLSITMLPDGLFCSFSFSLDISSVTRHLENLELFATKAYVDLKIYQTENTSPLEAPEETLLAVKPKVAVCSQWEQAFKISCSSHGFSPFAFTLLSI
uniref:Uncharacterized protein n=1 Tax=Leersia perrieri TaxID=77586 RepID=A0A0D9XWT2_9ORYZ